MQCPPDGFRGWVQNFGGPHIANGIYINLWPVGPHRLPSPRGSTD